MKRLGDNLIDENSFEEILMGNEAVVRALIETQTKVVTSYPSSPTPEIATAIQSIPKDKLPFYFEFSVNEKVATEVAFGAALNENLSCTFFKSVGLNVALDSFVQLGLMSIIGGMVVIIGDDPGANSSQNEQDNRNVYKMSRVTVFEPASPKEVYEYYKHAA
ncbi:MAG: indolepyruvate ferredoxin oxidoreductase, partial [Desulfobacula sp.]|nr:indolepyruvate ferredoxin oxidoreductase [Desulfobacula sp.]